MEMSMIAAANTPFSHTQMGAPPELSQPNSSSLVMTASLPLRRESACSFSMTSHTPGAE